jgi:hypothetical protein
VNCLLLTAYCLPPFALFELDPIHRVPAVHVRKNHLVAGLDGARQPMRLLEVRHGVLGVLEDELPDLGLAPPVLRDCPGMLAG